MNIQLTTKHDKIGYTNNIEIVETALRERFGLGDNSHVLTAVAAHVWSQICGRSVGDDIQWGQLEVDAAIETCEARLRNMRGRLALLKRS